MAASKDAALVLAKAVEKLGGVKAFAARLGVSERVLQSYIDGTEPIPDSLYLKAVDVILDGAGGIKPPVD